MSTSSKNSNDAFLSDLTDGRDKGVWKSRYEKEAVVAINWEKKYLLITFTVSFLLAILFGFLFKECECFLDKFNDLEIYIFAFLGGLLGGTVFSIKWLIHCVAKDLWNIDRRLWRIFTPLLSSAVALIIVILVNNSFLHIENSDHFTISKGYSIGFLAGYFSDNAIGKLTEVAHVLFGSSASKGNDKSNDK